MTIKSIKTGWTGISAAAGNILLGDFESIATVTVGAGGSSTISFTSIVGTYQHLQIRGINFSSSANQALRGTFNSDSGTNYSIHYIDGSGTSATSAASTSTAYFLPGYTGGSTNSGAFVCDILDYANTNKYKTIRTLLGTDSNGSGYSSFCSSSWRSTSAVTSITITAFVNFNQYSHFALYGIR